ncbi:exocyst subunit exo70 family protein H4 [Actinidia rufa]|uniref:Exocyst subunit Exo70 family protein n=1 Tax=Actinidia rufa TaxID=165716 RepID=A0A7J0FCM3_9ERIC|nr:exocyst subunit exo70 family protein H4 [Actinidia rufa]
MARKGMMGHFFSSKSSSSSISHGSSPSRASLYAPTSRFSSDVAMERTLATAEAMITKWNPDISSFAKVTSLFLREPERSERFHQNLMETAMKRLQKEFYQILSMNRAHLDPESVSARSSRDSTRSSTSDDDEDDGSEDEIRIAGESITEVENVSTIAMAGSQIDRRVSEWRNLALHRFIRWIGNALELKINNWLKSLKIAVKTLFNGERILCDHVFAASESIKESCFTEISREGAQILFGFPEIVARMRQEIARKDFSDTRHVHGDFFSLAGDRIDLLVQIDLRRAITIRQFTDQAWRVPGGGVHHLTVHVMDYLSLLADYSNVLVDILDGYPPPAKSSLPESYFDSSDSDESPVPSISLRFAWLILVLLCKLGRQIKALQRRISGLPLLSQQSSTRNQQSPYIKRPVPSRRRLGDEARIQSQAVRGQLRAAWEGEVMEFFRRFNTAFEQAHHKQAACVVQDRKLLDQIKSTIARKVMG